MSRSGHSCTFERRRSAQVHSSRQSTSKLPSSLCITSNTRIWLPMVIVCCLKLSVSLSTQISLSLKPLDCFTFSFTSMVRHEVHLLSWPRAINIESPDCSWHGAAQIAFSEGLEVEVSVVKLRDIPRKHPIFLQISSKSHQNS